MPSSAGPTIGEAGEHAAIAEIIAAAPSSRNGDDAAVLTQATPNSRTVATVDMLIEGRHFNLEWSTPAEIGHKAIVQNFADIQAMGARPIAALLAISAPPSTPLSFLRELATGVSERVNQFSAELVGGDLTAGDNLVVSVTAIGLLGGSLPELTLDRAKSGQKVVASGKIGASAAGLALLQRFGRDFPFQFTELVASHCTPHLSPGRGVIARATGATAMTDNSDGLIVDLSTIAKRSGVNIDLNREAIAPSPLMVEAGELLGVDPWEWVLTGGEDHTMLATTAGEAPSGFRSIGKVQRGEGVSIDGQEPEYETGWVSF
ncbi:Thiamine-monophosphate kinase [Corynebacterium occultum]|uniref:Thiamine-monophosphate kinase n=1 Tax=Corynebacterium occultum TaxID=2675219 RepID=A0A6B8W8H2_9CORY|nr:thiamine-phosphate kinase [Corynebacterium occultum]QGU07206.1 Thiamine-monophosphate kinase [Corynebacterium occultum]